MALENFAEFILKTDDLQAIKMKISELDLPLLQSRDQHGNSILHLIIAAECQIEVFELFLNVSNIAIRNDELKLPQDLFPGKKLEKLYEKQLVEYLVDKLRNCEGEYIRSLIIKGWEHKPYLEDAIDKLMDQLNDNFVTYLKSIEDLVEQVRHYSEQIVNGDAEELCNFIMALKSSPYKLLEIIQLRNNCGLTLHHIASVFENYDLVNNIMELCVELNIKITDHMDRTVLHYLYASKSSTERDNIINRMSKHPLFDCVDVLGNSPEYYTYFPEMMNLDYCKEFVKSDLINIILNRKDSTILQSKDCNNENDSEYLKKNVGKALVKAFALVVEKRPQDPIDYLAHFLKFYSTNLDNSSYEYELLSSRISVELSPDLEWKTFEKILTFNPEIFSPFAKVARDKHGTPLGYKLLIKKLKSFESTDVDWFEIVKRGLNFALRDSNENTLLELGTVAEFEKIKDELDSVILNMINEENLQALKHLYSCGYYDNFPDIYELCGPDLFDVSQEVADFYIGLLEENKNTNIIFANNENNINWNLIIKNEMVAYSYNKKGMSVIHWAIASNNTNLFHHLVDYFPDCVKLKDCFNRNVCHYCVAYAIKDFNDIVNEYYPEGKDEMDCFDYLPEYYEFYQSAFRNLM